VKSAAATEKYFCIFCKHWKSTKDFFERVRVCHSVENDVGKWGWPEMTVKEESGLGRNS